jgi:hypothetical protein
MNIKKAKEPYVPVLKTKKSINEEAKIKIQEERSGKQLGLKTRFGRLNIAIGRYFRFKQVTSINGLSGHGKSTLLNMILEDFTNAKINSKFTEPVVIVHNTWEMVPEDEVIRGLASKVEKSHLYLLSSEFDRETGKYNTVSDLEIEEFFNVLDKEEDKDHYYFDEATTLNGIIENIKHAIRFYQDKYAQEIEVGNKKAIPKVVVALDHTLLTVGEKGETINDIMFGLSRLAIYLKKKGYMVIFVGQLNNEIEKLERVRNIEGHFPIKSDIYAQAQLFNACDTVITIHQPELLGIFFYGRNQYKTSNLMHLQILKQRFGKVGSVWLYNDLGKGRVYETTPEKKE